MWFSGGIEVGIQKNRLWVVLGKLKGEKMYHKGYSKKKKKVTYFGNTPTKSGPNNLTSWALTGSINEYVIPVPFNKALCNGQLCACIFEMEIERCKTITCLRVD